MVNPVNVMLTAEELASVLRDCGAAALFTSADKVTTVAGASLSYPICTPSSPSLERSRLPFRIYWSVLPRASIARS